MREDTAAEPPRWYDDAYAELRAIAGRLMSGDEATLLQPTALVHEVFVRLHNAGTVRIEDREHFKSLAARAMRQILVDHARRRKTGRAALRVRMEMDGAADGVAKEAIDILALHEALERFSNLDADAARVVELRAFGALTLDQVADLLGVGRSTVVREWRYARAWLARELA